MPTLSSFLDDLERITTAKYLPSDGMCDFLTLLAIDRELKCKTLRLLDDVLRARLKTVGVTEYRFDMEASAGRESGSEWRIYDVGGSRSQVCTLAYHDHLHISPFAAFLAFNISDYSVITFCSAFRNHGLVLISTFYLTAV